MGALSAIAVLLAAAPPGQADWATAVSPLIKVRPGEVPRGAARAQLTLARGECEGVQLVTRPPLSRVRVRVPPLEGPKRRRLQANVFREAFIELKTPSNGSGGTGLWPDPLVPAEAPFDSTAERPLVFYVEVCAPSGLEPGTYRGAAELTAANAPPAQVPLEVRVQPFVIPATSSLPNSFGISVYSIARGHRLAPESQAARSLLGDYARALLSHRLSAYGMGMDPPPVRFESGRPVIDFTDYDRELGPFLDGTALPSGARFTSTDVRESRKAVTDEEKVAYYRAFREHLERRGWKGQLFYYAKDEPSPADYPLVQAQAERARRAGVPVLVTAPADPRIAGFADILCPTLNCFFPRSGPETCGLVLPIERVRKVLAPDRRVWWYQSCNAHGCNMGPAPDPEVEAVYSGWASYMIDHPATANRAMGALAFRVGVDGELYFDTVYAYNQGDPWENVFFFGGNGDGTLFYPGTPARLGGKEHAPVASLRLKHIRDGLEDYEYLLLAQKLGGRSLAQKAASRLVASGYRIEPDPAIWEDVRQTLTRELTRRWEAREFPGRRNVPR